MATGQQLRCLNCRYDVTGLMRRACPECGTPVDYKTERVSVTRTETLNDASSIWRRTLLGAAVAIGLCVVGVLVLARDLSAAVRALWALSTVVGGSLGLGAAASVLAPREDRWLFVTSWAHRLWWLHLPWLVIPGCTLLVMFTGLVWRAAGGSASAAIVVTCLLGLPCWLALLLTAFLLWIERWNADVNRFGLPRRAALAAGLLGVLVLLGAAGIGLAGGVVGALGAAGLFEPGF